MPSESEIGRAVAALRAGEVIGLPTETVYGLAGDAANPAAVARIFAIKGRPATHPVIVHLPSGMHLEAWAREVPPAARTLAERFWPGPLTLVLPRQPAVLDAVTGGQDTVALRVPAHPVALAVLRAFDGGLAAPSANRYGHVSPTTAAHVRSDLGDDVSIVLDGGPCDVGLESTIVACLGGTVTLLRPGRLTNADIEATVGPLQVSSSAPRVPGSVASHYAPRTTVQVVRADALEAALTDLRLTRRRVALLAPAPLLPGATAAARIDTHADPHAFARDLYANLRRLDEVDADVIVVVRPPEGPDWTAVHDRLRRASTPCA